MYNVIILSIAAKAFSLQCKFLQSFGSNLFGYRDVDNMQKAGKWLSLDLTSLCSAPSWDHFGRHGEWNKYLATKILAKVANWATNRFKEKLT